MRVGLSFDLKEALVHEDTAPDDMLEEYDSPTTIVIFNVPSKDWGTPRLDLAADRNSSVTSSMKKWTLFLISPRAAVLTAAVRRRCLLFWKCWISLMSARIPSAWPSVWINI